MEKVKILCLHGFLGLPTDWDFIQSHFMVSPLAGQFEWRSLDYMKVPGLGPQSNFALWARNFNQKIRAELGGGSNSAPCVLVGYSLGGRLALQALKADPELYKAAIFVSTNPGLQREKDILDRQANDQMWAQKFLETPWEQLMKEWNSQSVFKDSLNEPQRQEKNYDRQALALALTEWSLAKQEDFRELVTQQSEKILWVSGDKDIKFASIAMDLKKRAPALQTEILAKASHRVLFDTPSELAQKMISFIQSECF